MRWRRSKGERPVASATEEEIYAKLGLDYIPPELRENTGEIDAAAEHRLPATGRTEGYSRRSADAHHGQRRQELHRGDGAGGEGAWLRIYRADRSQQGRHGGQWPGRKAHARADPENPRGQCKAILGIRILASSEVDILKNGRLDLDDEVLAQLDVVLVSIHSYMNLERAEMTDRILAAIENPYTQIVGHPTGRLLLRRDAYAYDMERILDAARKYGVVMECNASPGAPRPERHPPAHGQRARRENRDFDRRAHHARPAGHALRRANGAARLAGEEGRDQHASVEMPAGACELSLVPGTPAWREPRRLARKRRRGQREGEVKDEQLPRPAVRESRELNAAA